MVADFECDTLLLNWPDLLFEGVFVVVVFMPNARLMFLRTPVSLRIFGIQGTVKVLSQQPLRLRCSSSSHDFRFSFWIRLEMQKCVA